MSTLCIRAATQADLLAILAVETACFADVWSFNTLQSTLEDVKSFVWVATVENRVVGYVTAWTIGDEGELTRIAVLSNLRGQGVGRQLLQAAQQECFVRGAASLFLEVRESNVSALRLYARFGFGEVGRRPRYYSDGEDALILHAHLAESLFGES
jgi:ribosomal-protein-alanine N-acetyltransferase